MSCGPRVPLFPLHVLDLDAYVAEDLVLRQLLLDEVDSVDAQEFHFCLEKEEPMVKPGRLRLHLLLISP